MHLFTLNLQFSYTCTHFNKKVNAGVGFRQFFLNSSGGVLNNTGSEALTFVQHLIKALAREEIGQRFEGLEQASWHFYHNLVTRHS